MAAGSSATELLATTRGRWERVAPLVDRRAAVLALFAAALLVYGLESIAWPLTAGRDSTTYLMYYRDMWNGRPSLPELMLFRTPLAPLFFGPLLQLGGAVLAEVGSGIAYAVSIVAYAAAARPFGRACAVATAVALLLYPPYGALFHQVSSDPVFALVIASWTLGVVRTVLEPASWKFALLGIGLLALVLARPSSQLLLLFAVVPLLLQIPWRRRVAFAGVFLGTAILLLAAWAGYNDARYGQFTVSRSGGADVPFYRVFVLEKLVSPGNGPSSRRLADAVSTTLLSQPEYNGVDQRRFFKLSNDRMWGDLVVLSDRTWGWGSNYSTLRDSAIEAIRRNERRYAADVAGAMRSELASAYTWQAPARQVVHPSLTPAPASGEANPEPGGVLWWVASTPDRRITKGPHGLVWADPVDQRHYERMISSVRSLEDDLPNRNGSVAAARALNDVGRIYPRMWLLVGVGLAALLVRRPHGWRVLLALPVLGLAVLVGTMLGMPAALEYRLPFDPLFVLLAASALLAPGRSLPGLGRPARRSA